MSPMHITLKVGEIKSHTFDLLQKLAGLRLQFKITYENASEIVLDAMLRV